MATGRRAVTSPQRRQCVNCWLLVPRNLSIHDVEQLPDSVTTVLRSWVTPTLVTSEHFICNDCLLLIQERIASGGPLDVPAYGHESVCFGCGISILRSRNSYQVRSDSAERNIILQWTPNHLGESDDDYWEGEDLVRLSVIDDKVDRTAKLSVRVTLPPLGKIERTPSIERITEIERDNYYRERIGKPEQSEEVNKKLRAMSSMFLAGKPEKDESDDHESDGDRKVLIDIFVYNENDEPIEYEIYGEPSKSEEPIEESENEDDGSTEEEEVKDEDVIVHPSEAEKIQAYVENAFQARNERLLYLVRTFEELAVIVDRFNTARYDLGMVAGRQMSTTSGEFIVQSIEKDIMAYINEQIAILPDPDLKKKKAKPEEVVMIRELLEQFLDENMDIIVPEIIEEEEEEEPLPEIIMVYAVPGIGGPVDEDIINEFRDYITEICQVQAEMVMPRNIRHFLCPPLEKYIDADYETTDMPAKEEVATGGAITD